MSSGRRVWGSGPRASSRANRGKAGRAGRALRAAAAPATGFPPSPARPSAAARGGSWSRGPHGPGWSAPPSALENQVFPCNSPAAQYLDLQPRPCDLRPWALRALQSRGAGGSPGVLGLYWSAGPEPGANGLAQRPRPFPKPSCPAVSVGRLRSPPPNRETESQQRAGELQAQAGAPAPVLPMCLR